MDKQESKPNEKCSLLYIDNDEAEPEILVENFVGNEDIQLANTQFASGNIFIVGKIDDYVLINHLYNENITANKNIELLYTQYAVNIKTKEIKEITLSNYLMATKKPINIIAQYGEFLFVDAIEEQIDNVMYRRPGIISVENYLNSVPDITLIEKLFEEKLSQ